MPHGSADDTGSAPFGGNRCVPCLLVNGALLLGASALVATASPVAGVAVAVLGAVVIARNGYLVPYTPRFAPRLVGVLPWDPFHTDRPADAAGYRDPEDGERLLAALSRAGVLEADGERVSLDEGFESEWTERMRSLRTRPTERVADRLGAVVPGATDADVSTVNGNAYVVLSDGSDAVDGESWLSPPVAIAETAANELLRDASLGSVRPADAAQLLPMFLETCPACGSEVDEAPAGGCCGPPETGPDGRPLTALVCETCSVQLYTYER